MVRDQEGFPLTTNRDSWARSASAIRARAEARPQSRLANFLQALSPKSLPAAGGIQGGPSLYGPSSNSTGFDGYLLQWTSAVTDDDTVKAATQIGYKVRERFTLARPTTNQEGEQLEIIDLPSGIPVELIAQALARLQGVRWIEPNWRLQKQATSSDPSLTNGSLWGMYGSGGNPFNSFGSHAVNAWARDDANGSVINNPANKIYVGIIDEGIQWNHPDLLGQVGNPFEAADGVDNDGNGLIDDIYGWDFFNKDNSVYDGSSANPLIDAHGTHVAGTIGAKNDGRGIVGVAWNTGLISGKFLGPAGGTTADAILAIDYFTTLKTKGIDIVATNNSWGGGASSPALQAAIERANAAGILFVAAAGNDNTSTISYPAGYPNGNVLSVASITSSGARSSFSNYGSSWVDLGAPGSGILSSVPLDSYSTYNGTSMATPHVTGAVAFLATWGKSKNLFLNDQDRSIKIRDAILKSAMPTASLNGITSTGGRLNLEAALKLLDPSLNRFNISGTPNPVSEGSAINLTVTENGNAPTTPLFWRLSGNGINVSDLDNGAISGTVAVGESLSLSFRNDLLTEGTETGLLELSSTNNFSVIDTALSITINDTSTTPPGTPIVGTTDSDVLQGTAAPELISGVPTTGTGTSMGRGQMDTVTGMAGADIFVIGDSRGVLYDDGIANNTGISDHLIIRDFQRGSDKIQIKSNTNYITRTATINRVAVTEIYWDRNNSRTLNLSGSNRDELVARLNGTFSGANALTLATDFTVVP